MMRYIVTAALLALAAWCACIAVRNYRRQRATRNYERNEAHAALLSRAWDSGFRNAVMAELRPSDIDVVIERLLSDDDALEWPVPNDWTPPYGIDRPEQ